MVALFCMDTSENSLSLSLPPSTLHPLPSCTHMQSHPAHLSYWKILQSDSLAPSSAPGVSLSPSLCNPVWSRMSRQLSQLPTPDLPAGASPQFGSCTQPAGSLTGGHLNSMAGLKSLLQHPMKGDQRLKPPCDVKGEKVSSFGEPPLS